MSDLIDRKMAMDEISKQQTYKMFELEDALYFDVNDVGSVLTSLPSAAPERKTGHWNKISPVGIYECSECGKNIMTSDINVYDFCHGCGADMREGREE